ncbi:oligoribonuclease [Candidatus Dependentiae bacterium]
MSRDKNLIWLDLEMTGLNPQKNVILEIATVITDSQLNIIEKGPHLIIHQSDQMLEQMDKDVIGMHKKSGLTQKVRESTITVEYAEKKTLEFFKKHCDPYTALLAGNSVWQDRNFLREYMPSLVNYCYYRVLDVTAIKEVVKRWYPNDPHNEFKKKETHRALDDVLESLQELRHLRKYFFVR